MRLLFVQLALALFQIDLAVKHEMDEQPDGQPEQLLPGGVVGLKKLHNHGTAGGKYVGHMPDLSGTYEARRPSRLRQKHHRTGTFKALPLRAGHRLRVRMVHEPLLPDRLHQPH